MFDERRLIALVEEQLDENEKLLWNAQPNPGRLFNRFDIFLIPFSLVWTSMVVFMTVNALESLFFPFFYFF